jgi:XTP/dITP diphosphohydrolase
MKVLVATSNRNKIKEISDILSDAGITLVSPDQLDLNLDIEETGATFEANALSKAFAWNKETGMPSLADDSGLCVDALGGKPGILSARFSGPDATDRSNTELLLKLMEGEENRKARFVCVVALVISEDKVVTARGEYEGIILREPLGQRGFGYDPVFLDTESGKTFAQLSDTEKNVRSHRGRALKSLKQKLKDQGLIT